MCIYCRTNNYRKIYEKHHGPISVDRLGRTYGIHHIDGDHSNNHPNNLIQLTIEEHYDIHLEQGDWSAALLIASRANIGPDILSELSSMNNRERVTNGTHHLLSSNGGSEKARQRELKKVENGTHQWLGGEQQRRLANIRVADGTHNLLDKDNASAHANNRVIKGNHPSQIMKECKYCHRIVDSPNHKRWHGDKCKKRWPPRGGSNTQPAV